MKIKSSLITSKASLMPVVGSLLWAGAIIIFLLILLLVIDRSQMQSEIEALGVENINQLKQKDALITKNGQRLPSTQELNALISKTELYNSVTGARGVSVLLLLESIEKALPKDTVLLSMEHSQIKGEVLLSAVSSKVESLSRFLRDLESGLFFEHVMLLRQSKNNESEQEVQFDLKLRVSSL